MEKKNKKNRLIYIYIFVILAFCLIYWGLEIYGMRIGDIILSNQQKYIHLYEKSIVIHKTQRYLEFCILIINMLFPIIFIARDSKYNNNHNTKKFLVVNFCSIIFIYLISFILLNIFNMNYSDFTFTIIILFLCPGIIIALIYALRNLVKKRKNKK